MQTIELSMNDLSTLLKLQIDKGGISALTVTGSSMVPMLYDRRSMVYLRKLEQAPKKGDVILFQRDNGQYVLHRVIRLGNQDGYICCGDNCWETERVQRENILGVVCAFTRKGKKYAVTQLVYQLYAWLWSRTLLVRKPLLRIRRVIGRWKRRI